MSSPRSILISALLVACSALPPCHVASAQTGARGSTAPAGAPASAGDERIYLIGTLRISGANMTSPSGIARIDIENRGPGSDRLLSATLGPMGPASIDVADAGTAGQTDAAGGVVIPDRASLSITLKAEPPTGAPPDPDASTGHISGRLVFERGGPLDVDFATGKDAPPAAVTTPTP